MSRYRAVKPFLIALIDQGVASIGSFIVVVLLGRIMDKQSFGYFSLCYTLLLFVSGFCVALIFEPFSIFAPKKSTEEFALYWSNSAMGLAVIVFILCLIFLVATPLMYWLDYPTKSLKTFCGFVFYTPFFLFQEFLRRSFISREVYQSALNNDLLFTVLRVGGVIFMLYMGWNSGFQAFIVLTAAAALCVLLGLSNNMLVWRFDRNMLRDFRHRHWVYGKWVLLTHILFSFKSHSYPFITAGLLNISEVATLAACQQLTGILNPAITGIQNFFTPLSVKRAHDEDVVSFRRWTNKLAFIVGFCVLLASLSLCLYSKYILHFVYNGKYDGAASLLSMFLLSIFFSALGRQWQLGIQSLEQPRLLTLSNAITGAMALPVIIASINKWGIFGTAISNFIILGLNVILNLMFFYLLVRALKKKLVITNSCV